MSCECFLYNNRQEIFQGNSKTIFCAILDSSGNYLDLSGYDGAFYAKKFPVKANSDYDISVGYALVDPSNGVFTFNLSATDTSLAAGDYIYEVIISKGGNDYSVIQDKLSIIDSIKL